MEIKSGHLYFISDAFFEKVKDPNLKVDYENTKRPHYFAFYDKKTGLHWLVPCSSKVEKFQAIIDRRTAEHKPTNIIQIVTIQDKKSVLLFADMFPVIEKYIAEAYTRGGNSVYLADPKQVEYLEKNAKKVVEMLERGIRFTPTQPDIKSISQMMMQELAANQGREEVAASKAPSMAERMAAAVQKSEEQKKSVLPHKEKKEQER